MKRMAILLALIIVLLLAGRALAMSSENFRLDWFPPLTGSGGTASSSNYITNFTVGQNAIGFTYGTQYDGCLGYWCHILQYRLHLPLVRRDG